MTCNYYSHVDQRAWPQLHLFCTDSSCKAAWVSWAMRHAHGVAMAVRRRELQGTNTRGCNHAVDSLIECTSCTLKLFPPCRYCSSMSCSIGWPEPLHSSIMLLKSVQMPHAGLYASQRADEVIRSTASPIQRLAVHSTAFTALSFVLDGKGRWTLLHRKGSAQGYI